MTPSTAPVRLRGTLRAGQRGYHFEANGGEIWHVDGAEGYATLVGEPLVIEAYRRAATRLELLWAGPAG